MPSEPNFDDFDLEKRSESGIDGFEAFDEIGKTSEEIPRGDAEPVFGDDVDDASDPDESSFEGDEGAFGEAAGDPETIDSELEGAAAAVETVDADAEDAPRKRRFPKLSVFEVMLILSFLLITFATIKLFYALNMYGEFPGSFPWKTSGT